MTGSSGLDFLMWADDLVFTASSEKWLKKGFEVVQAWATEHEVEINYAKSGLLAIRVDARTPAPRVSPLPGIALVDSYKYLGVEIDFKLKFNPLVQSHNEKIKTFSDLMNF